MISSHTGHRALHCMLFALFSGIALATAQAQATGAVEPLTITKLDPPNWYSRLPRPLLLVRGTGLQGASFALSDPRLHIQSTSVSANGRWAQLMLSASPAVPENVELRATRQGKTLSVPYRFESPRKADDGMQGFSSRDVMYLIMTDRFADGDPRNDGLHAQDDANSSAAIAEREQSRGWHGGDLQGILQHLPYFQDLGVTTLWITPVYGNAEAQAYHGYHATDYYGVDPHFGTMHDLQTLAKALHSRSMKLVLDTVPNHIGPGHPWVTDEPTPAWFHGTVGQHAKSAANFSALINPHAPERDRADTLHGWFANALPDMNTDDPAVALYLRQNAVWWVEQTGADGLRIDTFPFVNRGFWHDFNGEMHDLFPRLTEVGEIFDPHPEVTSAYADGVTRAGVDTRLYTPFDFPTYFALRHVFEQNKPLRELADVLAADALYPHPERLVPFVGNHDVARFAQTVTDPALRNLAFAYLLTTRGMPEIYAGDELAFRGGGDPDNRRDFPGGFLQGGSASGPGMNAFLEQGRTREQQAQYAWVKQLIDLRRHHDVLTCGAQQVLAAGQDMLAYARFGNAGCGSSAADAASSLLIVLQRGPSTPTTLDLQDTALQGCEPDAPILGQAEVTLQGLELHIQPHTQVLILPCRPGTPSPKNRALP